MNLFTVRRGIVVAGIAGAAVAVALTVPALATAESVSPISSVAQAIHPGIALADGSGDPNTGQGGGPGNPGAGGGPGDPDTGQGGGPGNPSAGGGPGDPGLGQG